MLRVAAFILLLIATLMELLTFKAWHRGPFAFVVFGLTVWCFSTIWEPAFGRNQRQP